MRDIPRRAFLIGAGTVAAAAGTSQWAPIRAGAATPEDFAAIRTKWIEHLTGGPQDLDDPDVQAALALREAAADEALALIDPDPDRIAVFTDIPYDPSDDRRSLGVAATARRLASMATSWATEGSKHHDDAQVRDAIVGGVETVTTHNYVAGEPEDYSWYNHEIGIPQALNNTLAIVREHASDDLIQRYAAAVDWFVPDPRYNYPPDDPNHKLSTGGNRVDLCQVVIIRSTFDQTDERIETGRDALSDVFSYTTSKDGFYRDGGYIQHETIPYTATYGSILLRGTGILLALLAGSPWEVTDPNVEIIFDSVENCYAATVYDNQMFSHVAGRAVSRKDRVEHSTALDVAEGMLTLAPAVSADRAKRWREICLGWFNRDSFADPLATSDLRRLALFKQLLGDPDLTPAPEPVGHRIMSSVARPIHRRGSWTFTVSMARQGTINSFEHSQENEHGWYQGRGMTYLYVRPDNAQFSDVFWPTVDPLRMPGITAQRRDDMPDGEWREAYGYFAGGVCVDGEYAATGMRMSHGPGGYDLTALKSWFCLDDSVVALGSNITSDGSFPIETVMESRNLHETGTNALIVDGATMPSDQGWTENLGQPGWLHLDGVAGYVLLPGEGDDLIALREERTATWLDINSYWSSHDDTPYTRRYLTLYFAHGSAPSLASYGYLLLPGATSVETAARAANPGVEILSRSDISHAIHVPRLGFTGANFFSADTVPIGDGAEVSAANVASVVLSVQGGEVWVGIANPTHAIDSLTVELAGSGYQPASSDSTVQVSQDGDTIVMTVDVSDRDGRTHRAILSR